jgi:hypothetical protein
MKKGWITRWLERADSINCATPLAALYIPATACESDRLRRHFLPAVEQLIRGAGVGRRLVCPAPNSTGAIQLPVRCGAPSRDSAVG